MEIATYTYQYITGVYPFKVFEHFSMKVEVIEELRSGRLRIKFLGFHADGRAPGTVTTVQAKNVKRVNVAEVAARSGKSLDLQNYLDQLDTELIRKPYKDD